MGKLNPISFNNKNSKPNFKAEYSGKKGLAKIPANFREEFSLDIASQIPLNNTASYSFNGAKIQEIPNMFKIEYDGLLAKSGSQEIFAVIGYGNNNNWEDVGYFPMRKTAQQTFELLTFRRKLGNLNIAFKDNADNWDNNSGQNFIFYDSSPLSRH